MAIFNNSGFAPVMEQDEEYIASMYPHIMPTLECAYEIACEGYADIHKLVAGLYVSDVLIENAVFEGASAEALIEGAVSDFLEKAKAKFIEIKNKIVAWFKKIIENLKVQFTSSSQFVKKYKEKILAKAKTVKDYSVDMHKFDTDVYGKVSKAMSEIMNFTKSNAAKDYKDDSGKFVEEMCKKVNSKASSIAELKEELRDDIIGSEDYVKVDSSLASKMVSYCENMKSELNKLEDLKKTNVKACDTAIAEANKNASDVEAVHNTVKNWNTAVSALQGLNTVAVAAMNTINKEYISILRGLMYAKVEESYMGDDDLMSSNSIFESALGILD